MVHIISSSPFSQEFINFVIKIASGKEEEKLSNFFCQGGVSGKTQSM